MNKIWPSGLFCLMVLAVNSPVRGEEILVSAAASLTDVLREIGKAYESKSQNKVSFNFGSSSGLARQIDEGAPADLFFSADVEKMDALEKRGRIDPATRRNLLSNQLVIVVPRDSTLTIRSPKDLLEAGVKRVAVAEPSSVPAGIYARKYFVEEGIWEKLKNEVVPVLDARATLAAVESGNVDAGVVYKTDAAVSRKIKVVYEVPVGRGPKIVYPLAVVKESRKREACRDFLRFLLSEAGKGVFKRHGFVVLE